MSDPGDRDPQAHNEAAAWFARLGRHQVSTDDLRAFRDWRQSPQNAAAYAELEAVWSKAGGLAGDPEIRAATRRAMEEKPRYSLRRGEWLKPLLGAAAVLAIGLAAWGYSHLNPTYAAGVGEQRVVTLSDGSRVRLNTNSRMVVSYSRDRRRITLAKGEAFFEAAHDPARPFEIVAGDTTVTALGTRFDVRRHANAVTVTLVEGRVAVRDTRDKEDWTLHPRQTVEVGRGGAEQVRAVDPALTTSWTTGRLSFRETRLGDAIAEVNRYGREQVVLEDPGLADSRVSGVFDAGDTDAFVAAVTEIYGLDVRRSAGRIALQRPT